MNRTSSDRRTRRFRQPNGFTLMELLIVMSIITVLMLIGFPTYKMVMKHTRELSAKQSLRAIHEAEMIYEQSYRDKGYACNLQYLGGEQGKPPTATASELLPDELAKGNKDGYIFTITNCIKNTLNGSDRVDGYTLTAVPEVVGKTGDLGFCTDDGGMLKLDRTGGINCVENVQ